MPWFSRFVAAERVLEHKDVSVYHTYKNDDPDQGQRTYGFVLRPEDGECNEGAFDVRCLDVPSVAHLHDGEPPYWSECGLQFGAETPAEREQIKAAWLRWTNEFWPAHIRAVLVEAIDAGLLVAPPESDD